MCQHGIIGNRKRKTKDGKREPWACDCPVLPYPELTLKDMPEFKNRLYKVITTNQVFMEYNDRKYSREYAKLAIRVTENALLTRIKHDP